MEKNDWTGANQNNFRDTHWLEPENSYLSLLLIRSEPDINGYSIHQ